MSAASPVRSADPSQNGVARAATAPSGELCRLKRRVAESERQLDALRGGLLETISEAIPVSPERTAEIEEWVARFADDPVFAEMERERLLRRARVIDYGGLKEGEAPPEDLLRDHLNAVQERYEAVDG